MTDLSGLSDAQIQTLYAKSKAPDLSTLSDAELTALHKDSQPYTGSVLPFSRDAQGKVSFDSNAGILGSIKRAVTAPGDAMQGKFDATGSEGQERAFETAAAISPLPAPMRAGDRAIPGVLKNMTQKEAKVPTAEELKTAASGQYTGARESGAKYPAEAVTNLAGSIRQKLEEDGILAELSPKTFKIIDKLQSAPADSFATITGIDAARKALNHAAGDFANPAEQFAANRARKALDNFLMGGGAARPVDNAAAGPFAVGEALSPEDRAAKLLTDARGNTAAAKRSERVTDAQDNAERNAAVANSGQNVDNATRQKLRDILKSDKNSRGFNKDELSAMEGAARGTPLTNTLRYTGNLLGGGGGLGAVAAGSAGAGLGALAGGPVGAGIGSAALPILGYGARSLASNMTAAQVKALDELIRRRSPLYQLRSANPGMTPARPSENLGLLRLSLADQSGS